MKKITFLFFIFISCSMLSQNIREGSSRYGSVVCNFDGKNLREGSSRYGSVFLNVDGTDIPEPILVMLCL